jgi:hypothetical protein
MGLSASRTGSETLQQRELCVISIVTKHFVAPLVSTLKIHVELINALVFERCHCFTKEYSLASPFAANKLLASLASPVLGNVAVPVREE